MIGCEAQKYGPLLVSKFPGRGYVAAYVVRAFVCMRELAAMQGGQAGEHPIHRS